MQQLINSLNIYKRVRVFVWYEKSTFIVIDKTIIASVHDISGANTSFLPPPPCKELRSYKYSLSNLRYHAWYEDLESYRTIKI